MLWFCLLFKFLTHFRSELFQLWTIQMDFSILANTHTHTHTHTFTHTWEGVRLHLFSSTEPIVNHFCFKIISLQHFWSVWNASQHFLAFGPCIWDHIKGLKLWRSPFLPRLGAVEKRRSTKIFLFSTPALFYCAPERGLPRRAAVDKRQGRKEPGAVEKPGSQKDLFYCGPATCRSSQNWGAIWGLLYLPRVSSK